MFAVQSGGAAALAIELEPHTHGVYYSIFMISIAHKLMIVCSQQAGHLIKFIVLHLPARI
jgi:hypothetical protein